MSHVCQVERSDVAAGCGQVDESRANERGGRAAEVSQLPGQGGNPVVLDRPSEQLSHGQTAVGVNNMSFVLKDKRIVRAHTPIVETRQYQVATLVTRKIERTNLEA